MTSIPSVAELAALLRGAPWRRLAVIGDSVAEGVREPYPGYRDVSWIDRICEPLAVAAPGLEVLNLGRRDLRAREIRETQLAGALAFRPDLAIVAAGGNDALRRSFDPSAVAAELDGLVRPLRRAGADVILIELADVLAAGLVPPERVAGFRERFDALAALTRSAARRHGAILVPMRRHPASADRTLYASDGLHLAARGHAIVGVEAVRALAAVLPQRAEVA